MMKPYSADKYLLLGKRDQWLWESCRNKNLMKNLNFYPYTITVGNNDKAPHNTQYDLQSLLE